MKVVLSGQGKGLDSQLDPRFGRARYFVCVDLDTGECESIENTSGRDATQGAGISAAKTVAKLGGESVITGHVGPKAFKALQAAGIKIWLAGESTVKEAIELFRQNKLVEVKGSDVEGHW